jgi:hypothetical protein
VHDQALFAGAAALGEEDFGVIGILDVKMTAIAAGMARDELVVEVDADAVWLGFDGDAAVGAARRDGIAIGVLGDAELAGGDAGRGAEDVVGIWIEQPQMLALLREQIVGRRCVSPWMHPLAMVPSHACGR